MFIDFIMDIFSKNNERDAIIWKNKTYNYKWLINTISKYNQTLKLWGINKGNVVALTGDFSGLTIGVLGLAFKSKTDDVRESASLEMVGSLLKAGAQVKAYDPEANTSFAKFYPQITYCKTWEESVKDTDAVAVMTEWNEFRTIDAKTLKNLMKSPIILDTRNILSRNELQKNGFSFDNVGRPMETK